MKPEYTYDKYYNKQFIREMDERDTSFENIIAELATNGMVVQEKIQKNNKYRN